MLPSLFPPIGSSINFLEHVLSAHPIFSAASAEVDAAAISPLPQSRKIYQQGSRPDIRVPFREVSQDDTPSIFGGETNPPLTIYDTSGPYTDPSVKIDIRKGLDALRRSEERRVGNEFVSTCRSRLSA